MKLKKINLNKSKILKLKLVQTKIYKKNYKSFIKIEDISSRLKKALNIIYNYHINNKRIIFIGTPINETSKLKKLLEKTKHIVIPESIWITGIFTNQKVCFEYLTKNSKFVGNKTFEVLFQLKKKSDLIVVLDFFSNQKAAIETYLARIPLISLNCDFKVSNDTSTYKIPGNFKFTKKKVREMFFYSLLKATLKKGPKKLYNKK